MPIAETIHRSDGSPRLLSGLSRGLNVKYRHLRIPRSTIAGGLKIGRVAIALVDCARPISPPTTPSVLPPQASKANGRHFFISPSGDDHNDGLSANAPVQRWATAFSKLGPGDTLEVLAGTYEPSVTGTLDARCDDIVTPTS